MMDSEKIIRSIYGVINNSKSSIEITQESLRILNESQSTRYSWDEILGAYKSSEDTLSILIYSLSAKPSRLQTLNFSTSELQLGLSLIQSFSNQKDPKALSDPHFKKRLKIILNPISGRGKGLATWKKVSSMFDACELDIQQTEYRGHATDIVLNSNLSSFDGIIVVSGDGLMHEVINGICKQPDPKLRRMPLGIISAGSGNALAQHLCAKINLPVTAENCAYICIKGIGSDIDISKVDFEDGREIYSFLSVSWGYIADVDIESDIFRCCGIIRYDIYGAWRLLALRRYRGSLSWEGEHGAGSLSSTFSYFMTCNIPYIGINMKVAPLAQQNDGTNDLFYMGNESRYRLMRVLLSQDAGEHLNRPGLRSFKVRQWRLEPESGIFAIDGDFYPISNISVRVLQGFCRVLMLE